MRKVLRHARGATAKRSGNVFSDTSDKSGATFKRPPTIKPRAAIAAHRPKHPDHKFGIPQTWDAELQLSRLIRSLGGSYYFHQFKSQCTAYLDGVTVEFRRGDQVRINS